MTTILPRRGTAAQWTAANPVLAMGEEGYETDTKRWKRGDGTTAWNALAYYQPAWNDVTGKPAVIAAGADQAEARAAIGVEAKTVRVEDFRDGVLTDNQIITAAFAALEEGGTIRFGQNVTYSITSEFNVNISDRPNILIDGQGATLRVPDAMTGSAFVVGGSVLSTTTLTAAVVAGDFTLSVADIGSTQSGDLVYILSDSEVFNPDRPSSVPGRYNAELARVKSVSTGSIVLEGFTWNTYSITDKTVTVQTIRPAKNLTVRDLKVWGGSGTTSTTTGLKIQYFDKASMINCSVEQIGGSGLRFNFGFDANATRCKATDCKTDTATAANGIEFNTVHGAKAVECYGSRNYQTLESHLSRDVTFLGNSIEDCLSTGISTHGADTFKIIGNTVRNCGGGIIVRGKNNIIRDNHIYGARNTTPIGGWHGIVVGASAASPGPSYQGIAGTNLIIEGNHIDISGPAYGSGDVSAIRVYSPLIDARITGNILKGFNGHGISAVGDYNIRTIISDNAIDCSAQSTVYDYYAINLNAVNTLSTCINTYIQIERNIIIGPVSDSAFYIDGGPTSGPVSDHINIRENRIIGTTGDAPVKMNSGYYGSNCEIYANEFPDAQAVIITVANWVAPPYIGANGYGRGPQPFGVGQELGARMRPNFFYGPAGPTASSVATTLNRLTAVPLFLPRRVTLDRIGVSITAASGSAGSLGLLGIYAEKDDGYGGYPGNLISGSTGSVLTDAVAYVEANITVTLNPGLYWLAFVPQTAAPSTIGLNHANQMIGKPSGGPVAFMAGYRQNDVTGALPATFTTEVDGGNSLSYVQVHVAATSTL